MMMMDVDDQSYSSTAILSTHCTAVRIWRSVQSPLGCPCMRVSTIVHLTVWSMTHDLQVDILAYRQGPIENAANGGDIQTNIFC